MKGLTSTSYAILGQLALRPWTTYELATEIRRNYRYFWPHAERAVYTEAKRLAALGLAKAEGGFVGKRPRTTYSITPAGRAALDAWFSTPPSGVTLEFEGLIRVLLAPFATTEQVRMALVATRTESERLLQAGATIAHEYLEGRAPFQEHIATRAFVVDFACHYARMIRDWAERTATEIEVHRSLPPEERHRRGLAHIRWVLTEAGADAPAASGREERSAGETIATKPAARRRRRETRFP